MTTRYIVQFYSRSQRQWVDIGGAHDSQDAAQRLAAEYAARQSELNKGNAEKYRVDAVSWRDQPPMTDAEAMGFRN
jgi:hypothetical protein